MQLNPFNIAMENDYMLYLKVIIQDDFLARSEEKKIFLLKIKIIVSKITPITQCFQKIKVVSY